LLAVTWDRLEDAMSASWSIIKHQATSCDKLSRVNLFLDSSVKHQASSDKL